VYKSTPLFLGGMMIKKYIYALDLSQNSSGICIFTNDGKFVKAFTIDTNGEKETRLKLKLIGNRFIEIMKEYPPDTIVIEQGFTLYNQSTQAIFACKVWQFICRF
jgi:Holliday junction resolvasome RuvABC endonuclease subunit